MKYLLLCLFNFSSILFFSQVLFKFQNDSLYNYTYVGGDEFNDTTINQDNWTLEPWPRTNMAQFFAYNKNNTRINNGVVEFALKENDSLYTIHPNEVDSAFIRKQKINLIDNTYRLKYTAGIIISKQKVHYGLYELRFKVEEGKGVWPAFWFYGGNKNEEIDVFELKGEKNNKIHIDTHCPEGCDRGYKNKLGFSTNWGGWMPVENYLHDGFNIVMFDWKPEELIWYINGYPLAYFKGSFPNPMYLFLNTQVASRFSAFQPGPDKTTVCPNKFYVDYLRVWQLIPNNDSVILQHSSNFKFSNKFVSNNLNTPSKHRGLMYNKKKFKTEEGFVSLVLSTNNKITITVLGELNTNKTKLELKSTSNVYSINYPNFEKEIQLGDNEHELEFRLTNNGKTYLRTIKIGTAN